MNEIYASSVCLSICLSIYCLSRIIDTTEKKKRQPSRKKLHRKSVYTNHFK